MRTFDNFVMIILFIGLILLRGVVWGKGSNAPKSLAKLFSPFTKARTNLLKY